MNIISKVLKIVIIYLDDLIYFTVKKDKKDIEIGNNNIKI